MIEGLLFTQLSVIDTKGGAVLHGMKSGDLGYSGFGESYFSTIHPGAIKGWKLHYEMVLNLVVPVGCVKFVIFDNRDHSETFGEFTTIELSQNNYGRLTIPPKLWFGFEGIDEKDSLVLNIASIHHDPNEFEQIDLDQINYDWTRNN